jgi:hypothetical protein
MLERAEAFFLSGVHQGAGGLFGQPPGLRLDVEASHPNLPQPDKYVTSLGVLVDARGANTSSKNTFSSELRRGLFYGPHAVDAILGPLGHTFPTNTRDIVHFQRPLESMARKKDDYDTYVLDAAKADYLESLRFWLEGNLPVRPASLFEACNKDALMPSLPLMTACGFGHPGKKEKYVVCCCERSCTDPHCGLTHPGVDDYVVPGRTNYYPCAEIFAEVVDLENKLAGGEHDLAVFKTTLKDEPVALGKDKIRAFYVGSMALNLLVRRYLMPFMCRLQQHRDYECEVGIDVQSSDWEELQYDLASFGNDMRIGGDYKGFDLSTHEALLRGFYDSLVTLARDAGWDDRSVRIVRGLGANLSRPVYLFLGQAFRVEGSNPSGVAITTHANSGVNSLIHRYAFYMRNRALVQAAKLLPGVGTLFTRDVCLRTYGDDVIGSVRDCESGLNNHDIRDAAACFGMVYGPIDKGSAELPLYYHKDQVEFLKCSSVFVPELGRRLGCIALGSVRKSIAFERGAVGFGERHSTLQSALRLYFPTAAAYGAEEGRLRFAALRDVFLGALTQVGSLAEGDLNVSALPTYDEILESLRGGEPGWCLPDDVWEGVHQSVELPRGEEEWRRNGAFVCIVTYVVGLYFYSLILGRFYRSLVFRGDCLAIEVISYFEALGLAYVMYSSWNVFVLCTSVVCFIVTGWAFDPMPWMIVKSFSAVLIAK